MPRMNADLQRVYELMNRRGGSRGRRGGLQPFPMEEEPRVPQYPRGLAYPQGEQQPESALPIGSNPLWDQAKAKLGDILNRPREQMFQGSEQNPLTADQISHNRNLEVRMLPQVATARIQAESQGGIKKYAQKEAQAQKLSNRLSNIEKQMQTVHAKKDMAGDNRKNALRDLANQHSATWNRLEELDPDSASMHSKYNPETGMPEWYKEEPGKIGQALGWAWDKWTGLHEYLADMPADEAGIGVDVAEESPMKALEVLDKALRQKESPERAQEIIDEAKSAAPMQEGANPAEVAMRRVAELERIVGGGTDEAPGPHIPEVASQLGQRGPGLLEKFQKKLPSNEEYIQGGGMPGMIKRGLFGEQPSDLEKYYGEEMRTPGFLENLTGLDKQVEQAMQRRR